MIMKTCLDCLHCKVSVTSTKNSRFCFCSAAKTREDYNYTFWLTHPLCESFNDMSEHEYKTRMMVIPTMSVNRLPLIRNRLYV
jgi:hypothetical protein